MAFAAAAAFFCCTAQAQTFQPTPSYGSLSVGATSSRAALPSGTVVVVYNTGANAAYVTIGGSSVTATTSDDFVPAGGWMAFTVGSNAYLAAIETGGATALNLSGGSGLPTGGAGNGSTASVGATGSVIPGSATLGGMSVGGTMTSLTGTSNGLKIDGSAVTQSISATSLPLPTGAATAANQQVRAAGTSASFAQAVQGVTGGVAMPVSAGNLPLPSGAATAANQTGGSQKTQIVDNSGNVIASTANNLNVQCANCSGSGVSTGDEASFTAGSSLFAGAGGVYQTTPTTNALTNGQQGLFQVTANRALFSNLRNASGTEIGTPSTPVQVSIANTGANSTSVTTSAASSADTVAVPGGNTLTAADAASTFSSTNQNGQTVWTGTPTANSAVVFNVTGWSTGAFTITGTFSATVNSECTADSTALQTAGTAQWFSCSLLVPAAGTASTNIASTFTAPIESGLLPTTGYAAVRFRVPSGSYTSGTVTVTANETVNARLDHITGANFAASIGNATPHDAVLVGANSAGNLAGIVQGDTTTNINLSNSTTGTALVNGASGKKIYVTAYEFIAAGTTSFSLGWSVSTSCTSITTLAGPWPLTAQQGEALGGGLGPVIIVPAGDTLCEVSTGSSVAIGGHLQTTQF